ncbi:MAG: cell division protein FtsA [Alphaproteobacteria bacterium]|nr:cell division protein FtsA [Alphaproteobacteria bacterium]
MKTGSIVTVLDIGSTKVCCCIANVASDGTFSILGTGYCVCLGVKSGVITDIRSVERSIAKAVEIAENAADFRVKSVYVSISGKDIKSTIVSAKAHIGGRIVKYENVMQLLSLNGIENDDYDIIHAIPIMFSVDSLMGIKDPIGMVANDISVNLNLVAAPKNQINNLLSCLSRCHLDLDGMVLSSYASGLCVCDDNNSRINNIVIDFGAGTTSIAFFYDGVFCGSEIIPIGGSNITNDISFCLNISKASAERIKTLHGAAFVSIDDEKGNILIPVLEDENIIDLQQITKETLNSIIQPRVEEILNAVNAKINNSIFKKDFANCSVIITGGGSQLTGIKDFSAKILNRNVIVKHTGTHGIDTKIEVENDFSVAFGMIKFAGISEYTFLNRQNAINSNIRRKIWKKIKNWFENNW